MNDPQIFAVVELDPGELQDGTVDVPAGTVRELPSDWRDYWRRAIASLGVAPPEPIGGSWFVPVSEIREPALLRSLCRAHLEDAEPGDEARGGSDLLPLYGGIALVDAAGRVLVPQCCGDLGDWREWQSALACSGEWSQLWIGHPWVAARRCGLRLEVSQLHESADAELNVEWVLGAGVLARALEMVAAELAGFASALEPFVAECLGRRDQSVARTMAGLDARQSGG